MYFPFYEVLSVLTSVLTGVGTVLIALVAFWGFRRNVTTHDPESVARSLATSLPDTSPADRQYILLREYHNQGLSQSKISFWFSLAFAGLGFTVIVSAILMARNSTSENSGDLWSQNVTTLVSGISGIVIEAVSALFFTQSNRARVLMSEFFEKLRVDRKLDDALALTREMKDEDRKSRLQSLIAMSFSGIALDHQTLSHVLGPAEIQRPDSVNESDGLHVEGDVLRPSTS